MAMVMPRSRSSGALSIWSKALAWARPESASVLVIAAVSVVLPWSTCPIVPTFTCGFVRSNFCFATKLLPTPFRSTFGSAPVPTLCRPVYLKRVTGDPGHPPTLKLGPLRLGDELFGQVGRQRRVMIELHRVDRAALSRGSKVGGVSEHCR